MLLIPVMKSWYFQQPLLNIQCHIIIQKSFLYADLVLNKYLLLCWEQYCYFCSIHCIL